MQQIDHMETTRQQKVGKLLQREMGEIFQREGQSVGRGMLLTVTLVRVSPDLGLARVYLSVFPSTNAEAVLKEVKQRTSIYRNELGKKIRHQVRVIPELNFYLDDSLDYIDKIDDLLKE